jgi:hypothetical protein
MLVEHLKLAISNLDELIGLTKDDINDIKQAKHSFIFDRAKEKSSVIKSFENQKALVDNELRKTVSNGELNLSSEEESLIEELKSKLVALKELNKEYAKLVLGVSEFYNSLLEKVVPTEMNGYNKVVSSNSYLHIKA